jgi:acetylornithine deacetylase
MLNMSHSICETVSNLLPETERFLRRLIAFPSLSGQELGAMEFLEEEFRSPGVRFERVPLSDSLLQDPDYSDPVPGLKYDGRFNLRIERDDPGSGKTLLFNTHSDVVPPTEGMVEPWAGSSRDGVVYGRGSCDAKGQIATVFLVLKALERIGANLPGRVVVHLVVEEENGGNGSLAMARRGEQADGCVVLEPTDRKLFTSIRGAVWFRLRFRGEAGHSGQAAVSRSALSMAREAMDILEEYQADLLAKSRGFPLFDPYPNPMPITFGRLEAGNWPASAPNTALVEGVLGLLPNKTKEQVCEEMLQTLIDRAKGFSMKDLDLSFMYRHDSSVLDPEHGLPQSALRSGEKAGVPLEVSGMPCSCDAWFYNNLLGIPTVVYGPGSLSVAHRPDEQIEMAEIGKAAEVLLRLIQDYCGDVK